MPGGREKSHNRGRSINPAAGAGLEAHAALD